MALLSTAGIARNDARPFDQDGERRNPWWGDPSFRVIPLATREQDVRLHHLHIDPRFGEADLDVVLPLRRLSELAAEGLIGCPARLHYSTSEIGDHRRVARRAASHEPPCPPGFSRRAYRVETSSRTSARSAPVSSRVPRARRRSPILAASTT